MRISFVLGHELPFPPNKGGGVNSLLMGLCNSLVKLGHDVSAYSPAVTDRPDTEIIDGVRHIRVRGTERRKNNYQNVLAGIPYALRVKQALQECDILSCHLLHGFLFSKTKKAKIITHTIHRDPKRFLYLFSFIDRIYTGSDAVMSDAIKMFPSLSKKLKTIYNCVSFLDYPNPIPSDQNKTVPFLFVGRFSKDKGLGSFIPAFCKAAEQDKRITFKAIGPMTATEGGDEFFVKEMKNVVQSRGLAERIEFCEPIFDREKLDEVIKECSVVVLPSIGGETLNMSILECMRLGKALLISDLPANRPLNIDEKTGFFAKTSDADDWTDRILEIASDTDRINEFGYNAYHYGKNTFSCEQIAARYIEDFEDLIKAKTRIR